jgi:ferredoxin
MGHVSQIKEVYKKLLKKVNSYPIGVVDDEKTYEFLKILYSPEEAEIISKMPLIPTTLPKLSKKIGIGEEELKEKLERMADRGIVVDVERNGKTYYAPMWSVPGFIEMTLMRVRDDIPQKELSKIMIEMLKDKKFAEEVFREETQFDRVLLDRKVAEDMSEVLPYEVAVEVLKDSRKIAVALCYCRHKEEHNGNPCRFPMEVCMALNTGAEFVIKHKFGREVSKEEGLEILEKTSELGLMHIGDNVQRNLTFICNCCKCCCGILRSYHDHGIFNVAVATNYIMTVDKEKCAGCGRCARKCPMNAITLRPTKNPNELKADIDQSVCLGCGICYRFCNKSALHLVKRSKKIIIPETGIEKLLVMALERGRLQDMLFNDINSKTHSIFRKFFGLILKRNSVKKFLLSENRRKKIFNALSKRLSKTEYRFAREI